MFCNLIFRIINILQGQKLQVDTIFSKGAEQVLLVHILYLQQNYIRKPYNTKLAQGAGPDTRNPEYYKGKL